MDYPIRNVAFGGFDRQDVVRYLENFSRSAEEEKQTLREENDRLCARAEELESENASLRAQLAETREQASALREELDRETARREELEALRSLEGENRRLRGEAASLRRDAAAYARFRERVGSIECEARERADALEAGASEKMRRTMLQFQERYQELIRVIESTAGHVTGELRKVEVNLSQLPRAMDQADREFDDLSVRISRGEYAPEAAYTGPTPEGESKAVYAPEGESEAVYAPEGRAEAVYAPEGESEAVCAPEGRAEAVSAPEGRAEAVYVPEPENAADLENASALKNAPRPENAAEPAALCDAPPENTDTPAETDKTPPHGNHPGVEAVETDSDTGSAGRTNSLREAVIASSEAKAPEGGHIVRHTSSAASRENRNNGGLFGFGARRRPDTRR